MRRCWAISALIAVLAGCQAMPQPISAPRAPLTPELAAPCTLPAPPDLADYDVTDRWMLAVLDAWADCARRHRAVVEAWPR